MGQESEPLQLLLERLADSRERNVPLAPIHAGKAYEAINRLLDALSAASVQRDRAHPGVFRSAWQFFGARMRSHPS